MSRSGYDEGCDGGALDLYRANVTRSIKGHRGQKFLRELASAMDVMPEKRLISDDLIRDDGEMCAIGVVCAARGLDVSDVDVDDPDRVGKLVGIAGCLAAEIEYINDDDNDSDFGYWDRKAPETPEHRWARVRLWVSEQIGESK